MNNSKLPPSVELDGPRLDEVKALANVLRQAKQAWLASIDPADEYQAMASAALEHGRSSETVEQARDAIKGIIRENEKRHHSLNNPKDFNDKITAFCPYTLRWSVLSVLVDALIAAVRSEGASQPAQAQTWQPIEVSKPAGEAEIARPAWLYEKSLGVRRGTFGRFQDGHAFASIPGLNGCAVRDWGVTHVMFQDAPLAPAVVIPAERS